MAPVRALIALAGAALGSAAHQELLLVRSPLNKQKVGAWPVDNSQIDFLRVVQESLASVMDQPEILAAQEAQEKKQPGSGALKAMASNTTMSVQVLGKEAQLGLFLDFPGKCINPAEIPKTLCMMDMKQPTRHGKVNVVHAVPLNSNDTFSFNFGVNSNWISKASSVKCPACGSRCQGTFLGRAWTVDLPDCPVKAGTWSFSFPLLTRDEISQLPQIPSFTLDYQAAVHRANGKTAFNFKGSMVA
mmetsp:Transcript_76221/g.170478  ORF Transcript_76221/g.170478 Transcript_76221/m.170478 type:complete len:245 (-) Transcript_76221:76-810(-)